MATVHSITCGMTAPLLVIHNMDWSYRLTSKGNIHGDGTCEFFCDAVGDDGTVISYSVNCLPEDFSAIAASRALARGREYDAASAWTLNEELIIDGLEDYTVKITSWKYLEKVPAFQASYSIVLGGVDIATGEVVVEEAGLVQSAVAEATKQFAIRKAAFDAIPTGNLSKVT